MTSARIPAILITGALGAGKTTAILSLLAERAADERWAVLINDFGGTPLHTSAGSVVVREVMGCICCSAQVALRAALVSLLRDSAPHRLLIEASAAAVPRSIFAVLAERGLANVVELRNTVCVVDPQQLSAAPYLQNTIYREQIAAADVIVLGRRDTTASERATARVTLERLGAPFVVDADDSLAAAVFDAK